ncbi:MAG: hypothetical protein H0U87_09355 [Acidobacteria bacterium]|jgi:uncharacterized protein YneF (UPF0154 family)|nr:hypothetical protein [Acidobacteriota bacterium]
MSNYLLMILIVLALTVLGVLTLVFITVKYYWGERGAPPPSAAERKRLREEQMRVSQEREQRIKEQRKTRDL